MPLPQFHHSLCRIERKFVVSAKPPIVVESRKSSFKHLARRKAAFPSCTQAIVTITAIRKPFLSTTTWRFMPSLHLLVAVNSLERAVVASADALAVHDAHARFGFLTALDTCFLTQVVQQQVKLAQ